MYPPHRIRLGVAVLFLLPLFTACEQARITVTSPSAIESAAGGRVTGTVEDIWTSPSDVWGAAAESLLRSAENEAGFTCNLGPFGVADNSHATMSSSGNETVVCSGDAAPGVVRPGSALILDGVPCLLRYGPDGDPRSPDVTFDSQVVFTPSGHVTLVCKSKS